MEHIFALGNRLKPKAKTINLEQAKEQLKSNKIDTLYIDIHKLECITEFLNRVNGDMLVSTIFMDGGIKGKKAVRLEYCYEDIYY